MNRIIQFLTMILIILISGIFWGTWFTLSRSIGTFQTDAFLAIAQSIIKNVASPLKIIFPVSVFLMLISLILWNNKKSFSFFFASLALLLLIATLVITVVIEEPIDDQIKIWTIETMPSNWETLRDRWEYYHTIRTFTSLAGVFFYLLAIMKYRIPFARF